MLKKYELVRTDTKTIGDITLYRIRALRAFGNVAIGDLGGWIADERNLAHDGDAWVYRNAQVYGNARVSGDAHVSENAKVFGWAWVSGDARVFGNAEVCGKAHVSSTEDYITISPIGSACGVLTAYRQEDGGIAVTRGCFSGTLEEFKEKVKMVHTGTRYQTEYAIAIQLIALRLGGSKS